ncbi:UDP-N-acetylmuramoyl-tripeptide--D-alanyl-D-alanine ligase [Xanthomonas rydalmerensis]|uniref:UDP-N-acetylmuramoyl-tripeptide--D-alanyl-D-alanine ligase n=1 Tax=Xanthomonas rydalmerensis TaxID=3046274 RepID=A0ABZ0JK89_9XANT|nr:UDP-N-acetylmuramoyl-tripeptide--D-alanyl-D-alanine ligase [Xanthomonas sp. DM-2023]WOS40206.1 UDP-N-acetylmuramoyl-tripeptide--D-alanyl-D-alanine ligase [Xanthomonas sp. DM-2023]WOS44390.1 UDP-N-acetylmuramoyl-tripeptide--D-alanyl-D-alanine ligase [Xanthomonas sp. DM-2023]WOS48570.1 UDP-N-acetylmuramoyl-tripeptide--D-alanyl-D-alanine ligase [Xanthomonas sp. DM-2023]WOS52750.1 UDP-N-acetylmuramoyl-tripeptide--D-alanyl-D-alanine ligase [Xanthomonas sp. DM-2023]WOS56934.1 UDP-N-acetylmuramoyl
MKRLPLSMIAHWAGAELHGDDVAIDAISHDTRSLAAGSLYVALRGERFDGHAFAADAAARGASALLVERVQPQIELPQIVAADTQLALARIAAGMQRGRATRVAAITGSNGKTSVKALLLAILQHACRIDGGSVYANPGNRNNEIGLPLAVIEAPDDADYAIYEMGAGKPGDIAYLADIAPPQVSLVNNIAAAHLERMGSLLGVAQTKGAIYTALRADGTAVVNADDAFGLWFEQRLPMGEARPQVLRFGLQPGAEVGAAQIRMAADRTQFVLTTPRGDVEATLPLPGRHNLQNALAAAALALALDVAPARIAAGLAQVQPVPGRQITHTLPNGAVLIDDSYNANPGSLAAAIDALAAAGGERWLVLGDMRELGAGAEALHASGGRRARDAGLTRLYALGPLSAHAAQAFGENGRVFDSHAALIEALQRDLAAVAGTREQQDQEQEVKHMHENTGAPSVGAPSRDLGPGSRVPATLLVKGSRGSAMDTVVRALLNQAQEAPHAA